MSNNTEVNQYDKQRKRVSNQLTDRVKRPVALQIRFPLMEHDRVVDQVAINFAEQVTLQVWFQCDDNEQ